MNIIGHEIPIKYLREGLLSNRLSPSLLFVGPEGVGKKLVALELAKSLLCENPSSSDKPGLPACGVCPFCMKIENLNHMDLLLLNKEIQAQLIKEKPESQTAMKIEVVRHLDKFLQIKPLEGKRRIIVMEDADQMTNEAANALLKTLEEPPNNGQIVLLAKDEHNLPLTIKSRCAVIRFRPLPHTIIARWLNATHGVDAEEAFSIAEQANGSFSESLKIREDADKELFDVNKYPLDEFFEALSDPSFRKEGRERAEKLLVHMTERATKKMEQGDLSQQKRIQALLKAKKQLERHVAPRLVLESVYLELSHLSEKVLQ